MRLTTVTPANVAGFQPPDAPKSRRSEIFDRYLQDRWNEWKLSLDITMKEEEFRRKSAQEQNKIIADQISDLRKMQTEVGKLKFNDQKSMREAYTKLSVQEMADKTRTNIASGREAGLDRRAQLSSDTQMAIADMRDDAYRAVGGARARGADTSYAKVDDATKATINKAMRNHPTNPDLALTELETSMSASKVLGPEQTKAKAALLREYYDRAVDGFKERNPQLSDAEVKSQVSERFYKGFENKPTAKDALDLALGSGMPGTPSTRTPVEKPSRITPGGIRGSGGIPTDAIDKTQREVDLGVEYDPSEIERKIQQLQGRFSTPETKDILDQARDYYGEKFMGRAAPGTSREAMLAERIKSLTPEKIKQLRAQIAKTRADSLPPDDLLSDGEVDLLADEAVVSSPRVSEELPVEGSVSITDPRLGGQLTPEQKAQIAASQTPIVTPPVRRAVPSTGTSPTRPALYPEPEMPTSDAGDAPFTYGPPTSRLPAREAQQPPAPKSELDLLNDVLQLPKEEDEVITPSKDPKELALFNKVVSAKTYSDIKKDLVAADRVEREIAVFSSARKRSEDLLKTGRLDGVKTILNSQGGKITLSLWDKVKGLDLDPKERNISIRKEISDYIKDSSSEDYWNAVHALFLLEAAQEKQTDIMKLIKKD